MSRTKDIHGGDVWAAARGLGTTPGRATDFSASINPLGLPAGVRLHLDVDPESLL